jgi:hypothetical protein
MPSVKQKAGKTDVQLYDAERTALRKAGEVLSFLAKLDAMPGTVLADAASTIDSVLVTYPPKPPVAAK